jgi:CelD/BcsL family acetyltransferase involved in cellulose biosynthesis
MAVAEDMLPDEWSVERSAAAIEAEWRAFETQAVGTPFQSYEWIANLLEEPCERKNAVFVLGRRNGKLRIAFPLSLSGGKLSWLGECWNNYNMPLVAPDLFVALDARGVDAIWRKVRNCIGNPSASILHRQPAEVGGHPNPFAEWAKVREPTRAYALTLGDDWESFYEGLHSLETRRGLSRKQRKLATDGDLVTMRVQDPAQLREHVMLMLKWKSDQVDAAGMRNAFSGLAGREIFARYAEQNPEKVRLYAMHLDGKPIAIVFLFEAKCSLVLYQMAYDDGPTARRSPGRLLLNYVMEDLIAEKKYDVLDFSVGDASYKKEICNRTTELTNSIRAHSPAGLPAVLRERLVTSLKAALKSRPALLGAAVRANAALKSLTGQNSAKAG